MNTCFSLDIGSETIKILQLDKEQNKFKLVAAGITKNPLSGFIPGTEKEMVPLVESIKNLKKEAGITTDLVSASLPERSIFIQTIQLPQMSQGELEQAINWEAESVIPKPISEVSFDWSVIGDGKNDGRGEIKVLIVAAPLTLTNSYLKVFKMAGLKPYSLESESLALIRLFREILGQKTALIFDWGMRSADIIIMKKGEFFLNRSLAVTGEALTRAISIGLGLDMLAAEEYKKTYGLSTELEGKVGKTLQPLLSTLVNEIKKAISFFEEKEQEKLKLMVLSGGSSLLYGVVEYFTSSLGLEVQVSNPFFSLEVPPQYLDMLKKSIPLYGVATGLAMKKFE